MCPQSLRGLWSLASTTELSWDLWSLWSLASTTKLSRPQQRHDEPNPFVASASPTVAMSLGLAPAIMPIQMVWSSAGLARSTASIVTTLATLRVDFGHQRGARRRQRTIPDHFQHI
jgi:hypothetical protein